jgi:tRNA threonylcarbamoyladenosine biosynthesis protein TsaB
MPYIIIIDTALEQATVCLVKGTQIIATLYNNESNTHAKFLHVSIQQIMDEQQVSMQQLQAVAVVYGPGSYTGVRVGLASAKGLSFALQIPLITISSLHALALTVQQLYDATYIIPVIDARRMDVFTAVYTNTMELVEKPFATTIQENSFQQYWQQHKTIIVGNAANKISTVLNNSNITCISLHYTTQTLANLANASFVNKEFANIAYSEPLYAKAFFDNRKIK